MFKKNEKKNLFKTIQRMAYCVGIFGAAVPGFFASVHADTASQTQGDHVDNSKMNQGKKITAEDQGLDKRDVELTRSIRRELTKDDSFSTNAQNIKVITNKGHVTLDGPVSSLQEKERIEEIVRKVAGRTNFTSHLTINKSAKD